MSFPLTKSQSKYGVGQESTVGTAVAPGTGFLSSGGQLNLLEFVEFQSGKEFEETTQVQGKAWPSQRTLLSKGKMPKSPQMNMNVNLSILHALLGSIHYVQDDTTNKWSIFAGSGSQIPKYKLADDVSGSNSRPLSFWHERETASGSGAGDGMVAVLKSCLLNSLTLTFPMAGGPIKVGFDVVAFDHDYEENEQSLAGYVLPAAAYLDHVVDDFQVYFGDDGGTLSRIYPEGDVVVTLSPVITMEKRGTGKPYSAVVDDYRASFSFALPWDSAADTLQDVFDGTEGGGDGDEPILKELVISNTGSYSAAPDAAGEFRVNMHGRIASEPGTEGEGILRDTAEFRCEGDWLTGTPPYKFQVYETTLFS